MRGPIKATALDNLLRTYGISRRTFREALDVLKIKRVHVAGARGRYDFTLTGKANGDLAQLVEKVRREKRSASKLGLEKHYAGGRRGYYEYRLPPGHNPSPADRSDADLIFPDSRGNEITRSCLAAFYRRTRERTGLKTGITLYNLRHRFGVTCIKHGVPLKITSLLMGHADSRLTEQFYIDPGSLSDEVLAGALQAVHGPGAVLGPPAPIPESHLIPAVAVPTDPTAIEGAMLADLHERLNAVSQRPPTKRPAHQLTVTQEKAYRTYQRAVEKNPALAEATDAKVYSWLGKRGERLPLFDTWVRYIRAGRRLFDTRKRVLQFRYDQEPTKE
jgi:hypothetical protein